MYQALYRKYRSRTFDELVGQNHITSALKNQIANGEMSHAYLFSGTRGTGKTSAAKIFSRAVNCHNEKDGNPCNECEICRGILNDRIMDVVEMDAASNNGVDDIRELKEKVIYPPTTAKYKVYIIDEVHMLSKGAFNALLKILEEPPKHLIFILATTEPEKIPQTILSRTQRFNFKRIQPDIIVENLKNITEKENKSCDEEVFRLIANNSDGAMRDALSLLDQLLSFGKDKITYDMATEILGIASNEMIFDLTDNIIARDLNASLNSLENIYENGKDIGNLLNELIEHFRNLMITKTVRNPMDLLYTTQLERYKAQVEKIELGDILEILRIFNDTVDEVKYAPNKRVIFEMNLVKVVLGESSWNIEPEKKGIDTKRVKTSSQSGNEFGIIDNKAETLNEDFKKPEIDKNVEVSSDGKTSDKMTGLSLERIKKDWVAILEEIKNMRRMGLTALLREARPKEFNNNTLVINFEENFTFHYNAINNEENLEFLRGFFTNRYKESIEIKITISSGINKEQDAISQLEDVFGKENIDLI